MKTKIINYFGFIVLALLPIQNILVQALIVNFNLPLYFALWKEALIFTIALLLLVEILRQPFKIKSLWPIIAFLSLCLLSFVSFYINQIPVRIFVLSFRAELFWVGFLATGISYILSVKEFKIDTKLLLKGIYMGFGLISIVFLAVFIFGQINVLTALGFKDSWGSFEQSLIYTPICHSIDGGLGGCRLSLGFASPNHLAGYLLLVLPLFLVQLLNKTQYKWIRIVSGFCALIALYAIFLTYSRFAWLGILIGLCISLFYFLDKQFYGAKFRIFKYLQYIAILAPLIGLFGLVNLDPTIFDNPNLPLAVIKPASSLEHYAKTRSSKEIIINNPNRWVLGYGPGQSGTIAKPQYANVLETPLVTENEDIAIKNGLPIYDLPVPESWYIQVFLNGGILYLIIYLSIILYPIKYLLRVIKDKQFNWPILIMGLSLNAILIGNLFLHIWESQVVAIYFVFLSLTLIYTARKSKSE
jgi:hypothetical protein